MRTRCTWCRVKVSRKRRNANGGKGVRGKVGLGALLLHPSSKAAAEPQVPDAGCVDYISFCSLQRMQPSMEEPVDGEQGNAAARGQEHDGLLRRVPPQARDGVLYEFGLRIMRVFTLRIVRESLHSCESNRVS
eukprot:scaffold121271_cov51-Phaeocystis_antarctica.AAC.3